MAHEPQIPKLKTQKSVKSDTNRCVWLWFVSMITGILCATYLTLTTGASECECWVYLILNFNEGIQNHWTTTALQRKENIHFLQHWFDSRRVNDKGTYDLRVKIDFICLHSWFIPGGVRIPSINLKVLEPWLRSQSSDGLSITHHLKTKDGLYKFFDPPPPQKKWVG